MPTITEIENLKDIIKPYDTIVFAMAAMEPQSTIKQLELLDHDLTVINCLPLQKYPISKHVSIKSLFYSAVLREYPEAQVDYVPIHLNQAANTILNYDKPFIFIGSSSMPKDGKVSLSLSNVYEYEAFHAATLRILEMSPHMPYTEGNHLIDLELIDHIIYTKHVPKTIETKEGDERDKRIGQYIADLIEDGSTIQLGIGSIPNEVAKHLVYKKDLGIHTEMFSDGCMEIILSGAANGRKKTLHQNKHICSFALGSEKLYNFLKDRKDIEFLNASYVNDPHVISKNYQQVSINTTIEVDLTGQCNSETIRQKHYSGTGGQSDTAIGAQKSFGGKSFIALHSTATIKLANGETKRISKIVPSFENGTSVTLSRNDVDYIVTEFGVAKLKGLTLKERAKKLIEIAHPDFREFLTQKINL